MLSATKKIHRFSDQKVMCHQCEYEETGLPEESAKSSSLLQNKFFQAAMDKLCLFPFLCSLLIGTQANSHIFPQ